MRKETINGHVKCVQCNQLNSNGDKTDDEAATADGYGPDTMIAMVMKMKPILLLVVAADDCDGDDSDGEDGVGGQR